MKKFTRVPNALLCDTSLTLMERFVCIYIASKPEGWKFSPRLMAQEIGIGRDTMEGILRNLKAKNAIKSERERTEKGRLGACLLRITYYGFTCAGETNAGETNAGKTCAGKTRDYSNTNISKTETSKTEKNKTERERAGRSKTHSQSSLSSSSATQGDPAEMEQWFVEQTKAAAEGIGCPREVLTKFYLHWTQPTADGVPLWKTKSAFDFKARLMTWLINER